MKILRFCLGLLASVFGCLGARGAVVINEIFYHAPDDWDQLQWIELHNTAKEAVDIGGWALTKGVKLKFPAGTQIGADGYLVVCRDATVFRNFYRTVSATLTFHENIHHRGARIELRDAKDDLVDLVKFSHEAPWPMSPDGESSSLERICPAASGDDPYNWAPSPPTKNYETPGGTPGLKNSEYSGTLPPVIESAQVGSEVVEPNTVIPIAAKLPGTDQVASVKAIYRVGAGGRETPEASVEMTRKEGGLFTANIPGQAAGKIVHVRVVATGKNGASRSFPCENDLRPALTCWVRQQLPESKLTQFVVVQSQPGAQPQQDPNQPSQEDQQRWMLKSQLRAHFDLAGLWASLVLSNDLPAGQLEKLEKAFAQGFQMRVDMGQQVDDSDQVAPAGEFNNTVDAVAEKFGKSLETILDARQKMIVAEWRQQVPGQGPRPPEEWILKLNLNIDEAFMKLCLFGGEDEAALPADRTQFYPLFAKQASLTKVYSQRRNTPEGQIVWQNGIQSARAELRRLLNSLPPKRRAGANHADPAFSFNVHPRKAASASARERTALIVIEPGGQKSVLYDFVRMIPRKAGWKIHLPKESDYRGMTTLNVIFEFNDRFVLAEPLAFDLYRRCGMDASLTDFVRLTIDDQPMGYHLLCEQPNKGFLRRCGLHDDGNMYKLDWHGNDVRSHHEKKTHVHEGYDDLVNLVADLNRTSGEAQWKVIHDNFDVQQVATYFAVNTVLAHWDGYFNNQFIYHDINGTGKWTIYPWDQDKTMGFYDNVPRGGVFATMPLTFGMNGDLPPHWNRSSPPVSFEEVLNIPGSEWWRVPGYFSGPLLANPRFRAYYLARVKELLDGEFGEAKMMVAINALEPLLTGEVRFRAESRGMDPTHENRVFQANLDSLRRFVKARREYLLAQPELQKAKPVDWSAL